MGWSVASPESARVCRHSVDGASARRGRLSTIITSVSPPSNVAFLTIPTPSSVRLSMSHFSPASSGTSSESQPRLPLPPSSSRSVTSSPPALPLSPISHSLLMPVLWLRRTGGCSSRADLPRRGGPGGGLGMRDAGGRPMEQQLVQAGKKENEKRGSKHHTVR